MFWLSLIGILLATLAGLWVWRQRRPLGPTILARRSPLPKLMSLRKSTVIGAAVLVLLLCLGTGILVKKMWKGFKRAPVTSEVRPPRPGRTPPPFLTQFPAEYPMVEHAEAKQASGDVPLGGPSPGAPARPPASPQPGQQRSGTPREGLAPPKPPPGPPTPQVIVQGAPAQPAPGPRYAPAPRPQPAPAAPVSEEDKRWFSTRRKREGNFLKPPIPEDEKDQRRSEVFPAAQWEKPEDPYKVLYSDQIIPVLLTNSINSDEPGTLRLKVTQNVEDRWGHRNVIIPIDTVFLAIQQGQARFAQSRIPLSVYLSIFPDGSSMYWDNGQVGGPMGQAGLEADVNNHYLKLLLGTGIQALLQVGTRAPFGSPGVGQYQQNLPQEFAQSAGQGINQTGNDIIRRQFIVPPTLSADFGAPATISFLKNISFQKKPAIARQ